MKVVESLSDTLEVWVYYERVELVERFSPSCVRTLGTLSWDRLCSMRDEAMRIGQRGG